MKTVHLSIYHINILFHSDYDLVYAESGHCFVFCSRTRAHIVRFVIAMGCTMFWDRSTTQRDHPILLCTEECACIETILDEALAQVYRPRVCAAHIPKNAFGKASSKPE